MSSPDVVSRGPPTPVGVPFAGSVNYKFDPSLSLTASRRVASPRVASRRLAFPSKRSVLHGPPDSPRRKIALGTVRFRRLNIQPGENPEETAVVPTVLPNQRFARENPDPRIRI